MPESRGKEAVFRGMILLRVGLDGDNRHGLEIVAGDNCEFHWGWVASL